MLTKKLPNGWEVDGAWSPIAEMSIERQDFAAVALNDHQCLVMGGANKVIDDSWQDLSSVELYDKITNTWTKMPDMREKRASHTAAVVGNIVYVIGGLRGSEQLLASVELLDLNKPPEQREWTVLKQTMTTKRMGCAAAAVGQKIYVMGGFDCSSQLSSVEILDTDTQQWSSGPSMSTARHGCAAVAIGTTIYAIGGQNSFFDALQSVECLNVLAARNIWKWKQLPQRMSTKRWTPAATVFGGCIVVGGCSSTTAELWNTECQRWMSLPSMSAVRFGGAAVTLGTTVLVMGGSDTAGKYLSSGEQLHFTQDIFSCILKQINGINIDG